jgi:hypothetical protein
MRGCRTGAACGAATGGGSASILGQARGARGSSLPQIGVSSAMCGSGNRGRVRGGPARVKILA